MVTARLFEGLIVQKSDSLPGLWSGSGLGLGIGLAVGLSDFRTIEPLDYRHTIHFTGSRILKFADYIKIYNQVNLAEHISNLRTDFGNLGCIFGRLLE